MKWLILFCFFFCSVSCVRRNDVLVTCEDLPKKEPTQMVHFNAPISCVADLPFKDESLNQIYSSFFQKPFLIYEVKNLTSTTTTTKRTRQSENLIVVEEEQSKANKPIYYIKAFSTYSGLDQLTDSQERVFHVLYYETVNEHSSTEVEQPNNLLSLDYVTSFQNFTFNSPSFSYHPSHSVNIRGSIGFQINGKMFHIDKTEFNNLHNMKYMQIIYKNFYSYFFPAQKISTKIEACMLDYPNPLINKCDVVKKMLQDMLSYDCWDNQFDKDSFCKKAGWPHIKKSN